MAAAAVTLEKVILKVVSAVTILSKQITIYYYITAIVMTTAVTTPMTILMTTDYGKKCLHRDDGQTRLLT